MPSARLLLLERHCDIGRSEIEQSQAPAKTNAFAEIQLPELGRKLSANEESPQRGKTDRERATSLPYARARGQDRTDDNWRNRYREAANESIVEGTSVGIMILRMGLVE